MDLGLGWDLLEEVVLVLQMHFLPPHSWEDYILQGKVVVVELVAAAQAGNNRSRFIATLSIIKNNKMLSI